MKPCPKCDYDLTGLPEVHVCPECAFAYDAHATSVRLFGRRENRRVMIIGMLYSIPFVIAFRHILGVLGSWGTIGLIVAVIGTLLVYWQRDRLLPERMLFTHAGFMFYSQN